MTPTMIKSFVYLNTLNCVKPVPSLTASCKRSPFFFRFYSGLFKKKTVTVYAWGIGTSQITQLDQVIQPTYLVDC